MIVRSRSLRGVPGAPGVAVARACVLSDREPERGTGGAAAQDRALAALEAAAAELERDAARLRADGLAAEADILETNALMARDPLLAEDVRAAAAQMSAAAALREVCNRHAAPLAALSDPLLAARAADVRQLGRRAARLLDGPVEAEPTGEIVLVARDLGPADVAELRGDVGVVGIALAEGAVTSHAAIMARSLGLPMVVALGDGVLEADGTMLVVDGDDGTALLAPSPDELARARAVMRRRLGLRRRLAAQRHLPAVTPDGRAVRLLCNAATPAELDAGLAAGAEGAGLIRTELAFLEAARWPDEAEHRRVLAPLLARLEGRVATVRTLDFGEDKTPPFLRADGPRGIALLLAHPHALAAQLRAILAECGGTSLRVLLPLVESADQVRAVRAVLAEIAGGAPPPLGAMIETPLGTARAGEIAAECEFLSIGTNDLVQYTVGHDRSRAVALVDGASDPVVLRHVSTVCRAAARTGIPVEVCGEAAGEPALAALLLGLGVAELSVAPVRLDDLRELVRSLSHESAAAAARAAVAASTAEEVRAIAAALVSGELAHDQREALHGLGGALA